MDKRYYDLNTYFRDRFGCRVQKITVDAGLSCPNRDGTVSKQGCIYCNQQGSGTGANSRGLTVTEQLLEGKNNLSRRYKAKQFIAYFQSFSNTYAPLEKLKHLYDEALAVADIVGLSIGTRPDCMDDPILGLLQQYATQYLIWVEYGLQSAHDPTLRLINRGHDLECFRRAVVATKNRGIKICAHVILGLPGENRRHMLNTARELGDLGIDGVKLHLLYVIKGTPLEKMYRRGMVRCLDMDQYADLVCDFLEYLPNNMVIQRLTSDPHPLELIAPKWALKKMETLSLIKEMLEKRDGWQGKRA